MTERDTQRGVEEIGACHVCGQTFSTQEALLRHLEETHQEDVLAGGPNQPFQADRDGN